MAARTNGLTEKDLATLDYIVEFEKKHLFPPSLREICDATGLRSTSSAFNRIRKLEDYGKLTIDEIGRITIKGFKVESKDPENGT